MRLIRWALRVGKHLPARGAPMIAALGARSLMLFKPPMYHHAKENLHHVLGAAASPKTLRRTLYQLLCNTVRRYYEFFYNVGRGRMRAIDFTPPTYIHETTKIYIQEALEVGKGVMFIACHTSNFDFGGIALAQHLPVPLQVLSLADPTTDMKMFNDMREQCGVRMTPISPQSLREAIRRLRAGEAIATGPDYPTGEGDAAVEFFGATAYLPTGYIRLALKTDCQVIVIAIHYAKGAYWVLGQPPMAMERTGDRQQDQALNHRRILDHVESFIHQHPEEWMMFTPVWKSA